MNCAMSCGCTGACRIPPYQCGGYVPPMGWVGNELLPVGPPARGIDPMTVRIAQLEAHIKRLEAAVEMLQNRDLANLQHGRCSR